MRERERCKDSHLQGTSSQSDCKHCVERYRQADLQKEQETTTETDRQTGTETKDSETERLAGTETESNETGWHRDRKTVRQTGTETESNETGWHRDRKTVRQTGSGTETERQK